MAKTNTPFLSLASQGSVGESITSQRGRGDTVIRRLPIPTDPYTLPQAYQRWLYQDYAYLWTQQSDAVKSACRTSGSREHLTAFQFYIKYSLTHLTDIVGMWHLDEKSGAVLHDYSRYENHGTIIGASPTTGVIDGSLNFDGINDRCTVPSHTSLNIVQPFTIELFVYFHTIPLVKGHHEYLSIKEGIYRVIARKEPRLQIVWWSINGNNYWYYSAPGFAPDTLYHLLIVVKANLCYVYINGNLLSSGVSGNAPAARVLTNPLTIGAFGAFYPCHAWIDHHIIYTRELDTTEIKRHSERSYAV